MKREYKKQGIFLGIFMMLVIFCCFSMTEVKLGKIGSKENTRNMIYSMEVYSEWEKTYGGSQDDYCFSIQKTNDESFILAGCKYSKDNSDGWLAKIGEYGEIIWEKEYGGYSDDCLYWVEQTNDGGYIATGKTFSPAYDSFMGWLLKLDGNGKKEWEKIFGGGNEDCFYSVHQTSDGGFILGGYTNSFGSGDADIWLLKLDGNGEKEWEHIWGGARFDKANDIQQTSDGGYVSIFYYESFGFGDDDDWVYKLDNRGTKEWQRTFGGLRNDILSKIIEIDNGYIIAGSTESFGEGGSDVWVIRIDEGGNMAWNKTFGGEKNDYGYCVEQTCNGYIIAGSTESFGEGGSDAWIIEVDKNGNFIWDATFGGSEDDCFTSIQETDDGYIMAGYTFSFGSGGSDVWVVKIFAEKPPSLPNVSGETEGFQWVEYVYSVSASDPNGDKIKFYFDWGDGSSNWTNFVDSGEIISQSHIWEKNGLYEVRIKAQDENGEESDWLNIQIYISQNARPDKPYKPNGPTSGIPGNKYTYTTLAYDEDGDMLQYGWDWNGDYVVDEWTSLYSSGENVEMQHSWDEKGSYEVRVISKDEHGAESQWSDPIVVSMPYFLLKKFIELPLISFLRDLLLNFYITKTF